MVEVAVDVTVPVFVIVNVSVGVGEIVNDGVTVFE